MITFQDLKNKKFIMAGPNVIESEEQIMLMANTLKEKFSKYHVHYKKPQNII